MEKKMMIDYRNESGDFERKEIDAFEFCIRNGIACFTSGGVAYNIPIQNISQVYTY